MPIGIQKSKWSLASFGLFDLRVFDLRESLISNEDEKVLSKGALDYKHLTGKEKNGYTGVRMEETRNHENTRTREQKKTENRKEITGKPVVSTRDSRLRRVRRGSARTVKFAVLVLVIVLLIPLFYLGIKRLRSQPVVEKGKFPSKKVIAQAGKETLYGKDFNYELELYFPNVYQSQEPVSEEIKQKVLSQIVEKSILLQAAADEGVINLDKNVFNNLEKDYRQRNALVSNIDEKIEQKFVNQVKGEMISVWFKNINEPKMGLEAARRITREKIEAIDNQLKSGQLADLKQAGEVIKNDPSLALIDPSYQGNAYLEFEIKQGENFFIDPKIQEKAFQLPVGQLSEILVGQDQSPGGGFYDCNFIIMKINEREMKGFQSFEDWFNQKRKNYEVTLKI